MIAEILLTVSLIFNGVLFWALIRAANVHEKYEGIFKEYDEFYQELQSRLVKTIETMRDIDIRGSFESDDEIGGIFKQIESMILAFDVFLVERGEDDATEK
jgi:hypothetical protein